MAVFDNEGKLSLDSPPLPGVLLRDPVRWKFICEGREALYVERKIAMGVIVPNA